MVERVLTQNMTKEGDAIDRMSHSYMDGEHPDEPQTAMVPEGNSLHQ